MSDTTTTIVWSTAIVFCAAGLIIGNIAAADIDNDDELQKNLFIGVNVAFGGIIVISAVIWLLMCTKKSKGTVTPSDMTSTGSVYSSSPSRFSSATSSPRPPNMTSTLMSPKPVV